MSSPVGEERWDSLGNSVLELASQAALRLELCYNFLNSPGKESGILAWNKHQ